MSAQAIAMDAINQVSLPKTAYSMKEAQEITGLGRTTLNKAISDGKLKSFKVGRRRLFSLAHLEGFLKSYEKN